MSDRYSDPIDNTEIGPNWKRYLGRLNPKQKRMAVILTATAVFFLICAVGYSSKESAKQARGNTAQAAAAVKDIKMDEGVLEKSLFKATRGLVEQQQKVIDDLKAQVEEKERPVQVIYTHENPPPLPVQKEQVEAKPAEKKAVVQTTPKDLKLPPKVEKPPKSLFTAPPPPPPAQAAAAPQLIGGIEMVQQKVPAASKASKEGDGKKKADTIYLPPSFMEATTLSGMAAPTTNAGKNNPLPIMLRIKDLAVLPNKVKADLKGCFVIGEGIGDLASERVHTRLKTLSCVSRNGSAVIDQPIKGWITDSDGRVGLRGRVVAKMGLHIARSAFAAFIEGVGEGISASTKTQSLTGFGSPAEIFSDTNVENIAIAGAGKGVANAAKELQQFYLQLAEQTLPVIEISATKTVTIVISEGVSLEIKEKNIG